MYKYLILDFGNVLAYSPTGDWDFTTKFKELIDLDKLDVDKFKELREKNRYLLDEVILTEEEEYNMFIKFYDNILSNVNYPNYDIEMSKQIAYHRTYSMDKYVLYDNVIDELIKLKDKYKLIMLTDNWPCVNSYLKYHKLYDLFDKVYISSIYGYLKRKRILFDYPLKDYNIKEGEALFIDDNEGNLDAAKEKGFNVLLMDRNNNVNKSKYKVINNLYNI